MGTLLKYEFCRSRTIFLGIIGVTLLIELVYLIGFFTKIKALFAVGLIGGILCLALGAAAILLYGVIMFNDDISKKPGYLLFSTPRSAFRRESHWVSTSRRAVMRKHTPRRLLCVST